MFKDLVTIKPYYVVPKKYSIIPQERQETEGMKKVIALPDYKIEIPNNKPYSSPNHFRILELQRNDSAVSEEGQKYISLSFPLDSNTFPQKYKVLYYAGLTYGNNSRIVVDFTGWLDIPPATYTFLTLPSPLIIKQGEKMDIGVQLKSSSGITPNAVGFNPSENYSSIKVTFNPDRLLNRSSTSSTFFGIAPTPYTIVVPKEAQVGQYAIRIVPS